MKKKKRNNWPLIVTILAFTISLLFSFMSESVMPKVGIEAVPNAELHQQLQFAWQKLQRIAKKHSKTAPSSQKK